ncbi:short-chain dehydrogenase [Bombardia bombarda]|uniref:Short-chain dehydrogenase n=1 Tax=Bombardia bombarda TaxID=252184 RepID=A0AA39WGG9_9PEZI|nr:short-chain dehydrogenase [Bombardia bombarda]
MFRAQLSQFFPPKPAFTEADVPSQDAKVFIVTGGSSGIGLELSKILYQKDGRVYIAGRSESKVRQAIQEIRDVTPASLGSLEYLHLDLADLSTIKRAVDDFKARESRLHVLWNNAGVSQPPLGSVSEQGIELQLATNCLGPFLFTYLLLPLLKSTAAAEATKDSSSVRVIWTASQMIELSAPKEGIVMSELRTPTKDTTRNYVNSKTGNLFLATELARRQQPHEPVIISASLNPGAASTSLFRHTPMMRYLAWPLLHSAKLAALTQLYAGLSGDITIEKNGCYLVPWGRIAGASGNAGLRKDLVDATKAVEDGGTGKAAEFWDWCVDNIKEFQ